MPADRPAPLSPPHNAASVSSGASISFHELFLKVLIFSVKSLYNVGKLLHNMA